MPNRDDTLSLILEGDTAHRIQPLERERPARPPVEPPLRQQPSLYRRKGLLTGLAAVLLIAAALLVWRATGAAPPPAYSPAEVQRGDITQTISAMGRLQALTTVQVGTQVSGTISALYADFNSQVTKGQVIARLDPSQFQAQVTQADANLASAQASILTAQNSLLSAEAGVEAAQANVDRMESVVRDAELNLNRTRQLVNEGIGARRELETAEAALAQAVAQRQQAIAQVNQARAQAQSARSQLTQSRAQAQQAQASVQLASVNLEHTVIRAPIDGVVVERNVDVGQTVAASLQAPTLFVIANDLTRMQVLADIDEADVGQLGEDSRVTFTVDAYPVDTFQGRIAQIRLAPQDVQNVVTYTAVIEVDNPNLKLKPGMTATVTAIVAERNDVLTVLNAAIRFRPESAGAEPVAPRRAGGGNSVIWRIDGEDLTPVQVRLGLTDGILSEVLSGELKQGDRVAVAQATGVSTAMRPAASPFQMRRGGRRR